MPLHDFKCLDCGQVNEFLLPDIKAVKDLVCSVCGSSNLRMLLSAPSLLKSDTGMSAKTCCGREERCETPACETGNRCRQH